MAVSPLGGQRSGVLGDTWEQVGLAALAGVAPVFLMGSPGWSTPAPQRADGPETVPSSACGHDLQLGCPRTTSVLLTHGATSTLPCVALETDTWGWEAAPGVWTSPELCHVSALEGLRDPGNPPSFPPRSGSRGGCAPCAG